MAKEILHLNVFIEKDSSPGNRGESTLFKRVTSEESSVPEELERVILSTSSSNRIKDILVMDAYYEDGFGKGRKRGAKNRAQFYVDQVLKKLNIRSAV